MPEKRDKRVKCELYEQTKHIIDIMLTRGLKAVYYLDTLPVKKGSEQIVKGHKFKSSFGRYRRRHRDDR